jgi:hypothetical protein
VELTFDTEGWCVTTCVHQPTEEDGDVCDLAFFEDRRILEIRSVELFVLDMWITYFYDIKCDIRER